MIRPWLICVFELFKIIENVSTNTEYLQEEVKGFVGCSVLLPCESSEKDQNLKVLWRHNDTNLLTIINGIISMEHQKLKFGGRTEIFPKEFMEGNFTLKLHNLTHADAGTYQCYIPHSIKIVNMRLVVNEAPKNIDDRTNTGGNDTGGNRNIVISLSCVFAIIIVIIIVAVIIRFKHEFCKLISNTPKATNPVEPDYTGISYDGLEPSHKDL